MSLVSSVLPPLALASNEINVDPYRSASTVGHVQMYGSLVRYMLANSGKYVVMKVIYDIGFVQPIALLLLNNLGMALVFPVYLWRLRNLFEAEVVSSSAWRQNNSPILVLCTSCLELIRNTLSAVALLFLPVSVFSLFQTGTDVIVTALAMYLFRNRKYKGQRLGGLALVVLSVVIVALNGLLFFPSNAAAADDGDDNTSDSSLAQLGLVLLLIRAMSNAIHVTIDEVLLQDKKVAPSFLGGAQGVFSLFFTALVMLPVVNFLIFDGKGHPIEDTGHSVHIVEKYISSLPVLLLLLVGLCASDHYLSKLATKNAGALTRIIFKALRPSLVWVASLLLYVTIPSHGAGGESWGIASWVHLSGLMLQLCGTILYNRRQGGRTEETEAVVFLQMVDLENSVGGSDDGDDGSENQRSGSSVAPSSANGTTCATTEVLSPALAAVNVVAKLLLPPSCSSSSSSTTTPKKRNK